jgi:hypothetical protein
MYQFDFVLEVGGQQSISVSAETYPEAVKKIKAIGIPDFKISDWQLEAVTESIQLMIGE